MAIKPTILCAMAAITLTSACNRTAKPEVGDFGVDLAGRDLSVKPGDGFWSYANGGWAKSTGISADRASAGQLDGLGERAEANVQTILDGLTREPTRDGMAGAQLGDLYASWMDAAGIEAKGNAPLKPYLDRIAAATSKRDLEVLFATPGFAAPLGVDVLPDPGDPKRYTIVCSQGDLAMPRENYLERDPRRAAVRSAYRAYVRRVQELAGVSDAARKADDIVKLETSLAAAQWSPEQMRDFTAILKPMNRAGLKSLAPQVDWDVVLNTAGLGRMPTVIVAGDTAIASLSELIGTVSLQTWKDWLTYRFISDHADYLGKSLDETHFAFISKTLNGVEAQPDRWRRGVRLVNGAMGEAVGRIYVERFYPPASEAKMLELVGNLRAAMRRRLETNSWMDARTRARALAKLDAFQARIGHPARYVDYSSLRIDRRDLLGNMIRAEEFRHRLALSRLGRPVDRTLWDMTPQTVNAYYNPLTNQITFPAAVLQPPLFDPNADPAVNYGAIGAMIGHEIGHGFDDQGSRFGPDGKFDDWWTPASRKVFERRTSRLVAQYGSYEPLPGVKINGAQTLGENIGDLNGVTTAYLAYRRYQQEHGAAKIIDGLTGDQRFFLAFAQMWRELIRENALRQLLLTNAHSPGKYRVDGVLRNVDAWYKAFDVKPGDKLYLAPQSRVRIW